MSEITEIIDAYIEKFDGLREVYIEAPDICQLLVKTEFQSSGYAVRKELTGGHYFYFSEYYNFFRLKYATQDRDFTDIARTVTHIAFQGLIYEIPPDNRIVIFPNGKKPYFQFFCVETKPPEFFRST